MQATWRCFSSMRKEFPGQLSSQYPGAGFFAHGDGRLLVAECGFVGTLRAQRIVDVHHLQHARQQRNFAPPQAIGISAAVGMFVMTANNRQHQAQRLERLADGSRP